ALPVLHPAVGVLDGDAEIGVPDGLDPSLRWVHPRRPSDPMASGAGTGVPRAPFAPSRRSIASSRGLWEGDSMLFGDEHVRRYRETGGREGYEWNGVKTLILTTTGRHSGLERSKALILGEDGDRYVVVASYGGAPHHPAWYFNLASDPNVQVQVK